MYMNSLEFIKRSCLAVWLWVFIFLGLGVVPVFAAAPELLTLRGVGDPDLLLNWVIVAEGFTDSQRGAFVGRATSLANSLMTEEPWKSYGNFINIYALFVASKDSGADRPQSDPPVEKDTVFNATYGTMGIDRLLTVDDRKVYSVVNAFAPFQDHIFVLVNDSLYGGSGGGLVTVSLHRDVVDLVLHELGHVIGLADEYSTPFPGYPAGDYEPNVTFATDLAEIPWKNWIDVNTPVPTDDIAKYNSKVGLFKGARYLQEGIYRPRRTCKMRILNSEFCEVCKEAQVLYLYDHIVPINPPPSESSFHAGEEKFFFIDFIDDSLDYSIVWMLDDVIIEGEVGTALSLDTTGLSKGEHSLKALVYDNTSMVRNDPDGILAFENEWSLSVTENPQGSAPSEKVPLNAWLIVLFASPYFLFNTKKRYSR